MLCIKREIIKFLIFGFAFLISIFNFLINIKMKNRIILWLYLSMWFLLFGGMLFDMLVVAVNWKSGDIADIQHWHDYFRITNPGDFFYVKFGVLLFAIVSLLAYWKSSKAVRLLLTLGLIVIFADMAFTMLFFLPINIYMDGSNLDPVLTQQKANSWFTTNYLRILLDFVGLYFAARALHKSYVETYV